MISIWRKRLEMKKPVLVIMAAGMGSRYGGLKQIDSIDEQGHIIIDFSIYDAKRAGFEKVVFLIKKEDEKSFKEVIGDRMSKIMKVAYAYQDLANLPEGFEVPEGRVKPWGTAHAVLSCKDVIDGPFAVINADDYYGRDAFRTIYNFLSAQKDDEKYRFTMVGYHLKNTLTENGHVARGVCRVDENGYLLEVTERTHIEKREDGAAYTEDGGATWNELPLDAIVSMNMWGFSEGFLDEIEARFATFLKEGLTENPLKCEYFLPTVVSNLLKEDRATVSVLTSKDKWYGVTYKKDKAVVVNAVQKMKKEGIYPEKIWCGRSEALQNFQMEGMVMKSVRYGNGHINDTFLVTVKQKDDTEKYVILQRMNKGIFTNPEELMENIIGVTSFLRKKIVENGGDPERETMNVIPAKDGKTFFIDSEGEYWRCYQFIEGASSYDQVESPEDFYQSAVSFGHFQRLLADYPAETLHETIQGFHDTKARFEVFQKTVEEDVCGRASSVQEEINFVLAHEDVANVFGDLLKTGEIPLRVTHNDTKLNNIMIDDKTRKGICVIDLDTVMPGLAMNDFGDSIRFGANTGAEDEPNLDKVWFDLELFDIYAKGFIEGCGGKLTPKEIELLPMGAKVMTFECGMRFLTDYLQGDTYFKVHRENHNLDRCRTQFKLVSDMETKWDIMNEIVRKYQ
jgi:dTDP-glucose pyrophosphorylase